MQRQIRQNTSAWEQWLAWRQLLQVEAVLAAGSYQIFTGPARISLVSKPPRNAILRIQGSAGCVSWEVRCAPGQKIVMGRQSSSVGIRSYSETDFVELSWANIDSWLVVNSVGSFYILSEGS